MRGFLAAFAKLVGVLLFVAAFLKIRQAYVENDFTYFAVILSVVEIGIGSLLLFTTGSFAVLSAASLLFAGFIIYHLQQFFTGPSYCDCFGGMPLLRWHVMLVDLLLLAGLVFSAIYHHRGDVRLKIAEINSALGCTVVVCCFFLAILFSNPGLRQPISVSDSDVGDVLFEQSTMVTISIKNNQDVPIRIVGFENNCACRLAGPLPGAVSPGLNAKVDVQIKGLRKKGRVAIPFKLYLNGQNNFDFDGLLIANVVRD